MQNKSLVDTFRNFMDIEQQIRALSDMVFIMDAKAWNYCNGQIPKKLSNQLLQALSVPPEQDILNILSDAIRRTINCEILGHE